MDKEKRKKDGYLVPIRNEKEYNEVLNSLDTYLLTDRAKMLIPLMQMYKDRETFLQSGISKHTVQDIVGKKDTEDFILVLNVLKHLYKTFDKQGLEDLLSFLNTEKRLERGKIRRRLKRL